jgi:hypothetical protein
MDNVKVQNIKNKNDENKGARDENKEEPIGEETKMKVMLIFSFLASQINHKKII